MRKLSDLFSITSPVPGSTATFTGETNYNQKEVSLDANSTDTYRFCSWPDNLNSQEYTGVLNYKTGGSSLNKNAGNFGVVYKMNISNASGKRIKIVPLWSTPGRTKASIVYRLNNGAWTVGSILSSNQSWYISLGTNNNATFEFVLPGGNFGNYDVTFD